MEKIYKINSKEIKCIINRRSKKNIIFKFQNKELHISVPKRFAIKNLNEIIENKKDWIFEKINYLENECTNKFLFLGSEFDSIDESITYYKNNFETTIDFDDNIPNIIIKIANELFKNRLDILCLNPEMTPKAYRIKKLKSAWGICYRNRNITLNLLLLMAPIDVIDYVIIHELSHLKHMNHSKEFWNEVHYHKPNFKENKLWLKSNGTKIFNQNILAI